MNSSQKGESKKTDGRRIARVEKEVQFVVSDYALRYLKDDFAGLVTISRVIIPGDLRSAKVFVSLLETHSQAKSKKDDQEIDEVLEIFRSHARQIQNEISRKIQMKYLPKLSFFKDESTEKILEVEKMIQKVSTVKG